MFSKEGCGKLVSVSFLKARFGITERDMNLATFEVTPTSSLPRFLNMDMRRDFILIAEFTRAASIHFIHRLR